MTVRSLRDKTRRPFLATLLPALLVLSIPAARASYREYPQNAGKVQPILVPALPNWLWFDGEARERPEGRARSTSSPALRTAMS
jgi:hypothetical protein